ncbi:hypothetical protein [Paenibacillus periandrae]|uniref:hypothetical protein n=1 Tax=Paenibacillus periandrae TaxID=1761741 RepID=UPI001F092698|nr:hypothetical protein [Paenibacillus periandrae]
MERIFHRVFSFNAKIRRVLLRGFFVIPMLPDIPIYYYIVEERTITNLRLFPRRIGGLYRVKAVVFFRFKYDYGRAFSGAVF